MSDEYDTSSDEENDDEGRDDLEVRCRTARSPFLCFLKFADQNQDFHIAWYVGKASYDVENGVCNKSSRQIVSFREHLPPTHLLFNARASAAKVLKSNPRATRTYFFSNLSEMETWKMLYGKIHCQHPNLNIREANGNAQAHCYLHLYALNDGKLKIHGNVYLPYVALSKCFRF